MHRKACSYLFDCSFYILEEERTVGASNAGNGKRRRRRMGRLVRSFLRGLECSAAFIADHFPGLSFLSGLSSGSLEAKVMSGRKSSVKYPFCSSRTLQGMIMDLTICWPGQSLLPISVEREHALIRTWLPALITNLARCYAHFYF
eukprot:80828-Pelagomonas_calceolata.AAC.2